MNRIEHAYDADPEYEWHRLERHRVEYGLTMRALEEHLPPAAEIIDIGGGVGRYAIELTRCGYQVTLADISAKCLDFAQDKAAEASVELAEVVKADARDLSAFADESFDAALLMGPLYHLLEHAERLQALREACRALRPGGRVFASFVNRFTIVRYAAAHDVECIKTKYAELEKALRTGIDLYRRRTADGQCSDFWFWMAFPGEVAPLMVQGGFQQIDLLACGAWTENMDKGLAEVPADIYQRWIDLLYPLSKDPSILGSAGHLLYVGNKEEARQ